MSRSSVSDPAQRVELTERQQAVIQLMAKGLTNSEIAERIGVTLDGVKWHVREILGKFGVDSREEAVARWRERAKGSRGPRVWAGLLWGSTAARWATGLAVVGGAGIAGTAAMVHTLRSEDEPEAVAPAAIASPTPDLSTSQGLTLSVTKAEADDTQTTIEFRLEGRPELGRFLGSALVGAAEMPKLTDDHDNTYRLHGSGGSIDGRFMRMVFEPVPKDVRSLTLRLPSAGFVAPEDEPPLGAKPPDASTVINGPWVDTTSNVVRLGVERYALSLPALTVGPGTFQPVEIIQTANGMIIRAKVTQIGGDYGFLAWPILTDASGAVVALANVGAGGTDELWDTGFQTVHGEVTLTLRPVVLHFEDTAIRCLNADSTQCPDEAEIAEMKREQAARSSALEALISSQAPPSWRFEIP
jgi:DNA-binding CsgD family transcriptional regulator